MPRQREFDEDEVLDAATRTFWRKGYEATSLSDVLEATGLARQSLYNAFGDKHALYVACLRRYADVRAGAIEQALARGPVRAGLRALFDGVASVPSPELRQGCFVLNSAAELAPRDPAVGRIASAALARQERLFADALQRGVREGELRMTRRRVEQVARFLVSTLQGIQMLAKADPGSPALADTVQLALEVLD